MAFPAAELWLPLGPCQVVLGTVTIQRSNNVVIRDTVMKEPIQYDEEGAAPADEVNVGNDIMLLIDIAKETWENLAVIVPTLYSVGTAPNELIERKSNVGEQDTLISVVAVVKPYVSGVPATSSYKWYTFPKVAVTQTLEIVHAARGQRFFQIQCRAYPDAATGRYWYKGTAV